MGKFKPLMDLNGHTVIENAVDCFLKAGISDVRVVIGYNASEMIPILEKLGVTYTINKHYQQGMFSSVHAGLNSFEGFYSGVFILPGDVPMVKSRTVEIILNELRISGAGIIYPCFSGERGHPPFISSKYFGEILSSDPSENLRSVLSRFEDDSRNVELIDESILMDIDTPDDFNEAVKYLNHRNVPSKNECAAIFLKYKTSESVIKHGDAVSEISCRIAGLLNGTGRIFLDIDLIRAGALLHDIARDKPDHAVEGALILEQLGFPDVAKIIRWHMDIEFDGNNSYIDETAIVYLADKMVKEDMFISLKERFGESLEKFSTKPEVLKNISKRKKNAFLIKEKIEKIAGVSDLESVLNVKDIHP